ncbi:glycosyl hydrolase family 65 protein [Brevundimonas sp.]|uniref:glycoside hydrolase family 65 protein n=1 Tax=Brevundimonas sp. TaxID=1871086 RepID=UPI001A266077|nr:glycosyl hydrolase family 65 protein [Brevundimonas sp.]MBJ7484956.1 glycoside hydrolase family 65 protein [Brevundimonas sp.]
MTWCGDALFEPTIDPAWRLDAVGDDALRESSRQSRFALSNGFLGVRGERRSSHGDPLGTASRTLVAGLFDTGQSLDAVPTLIPAPDWLQVRLVFDDGALVRDAAAPEAFHSLDMKRGLLLGGCRFSNDEAVAQVRALRLVSLRRRSLGLQTLRIVVEKGECKIGIQATAASPDPALVLERHDGDLSLWRTHRSHKQLTVAEVVSVRVDGVLLAPDARSTPACWTARAGQGQVVEFERLVVFGVGDQDNPSPGPAARAELEAATSLGWRGALKEHEAVWAARWAACDIQIDGDPQAQRALRFAAYHLNGAANPDDETVSIAARGLTGADYAGHVFWDTEIFLLPFFAHTWPNAARALLMYRFHTLDGARTKAARLGWRGALYAWESADTGAEVTPAHAVGPDRRVVEILSGTQEQHISADVAYAVWQYWTVTGDKEFMRDAGVEILLETARFWASRATLEDDGRRHIRGVIGPDEYHDGIDDNAFTNVMARWNIERGGDAAALMRERWPERWEELSARLGFDGSEVEGWAGIATTIETGLDVRTGLFEQFEGYGDLEPIDLEAYAGRSVPMDVVLGRERTRRSQVIKQADVVALMALLPEVFPAGADSLNFEHYAPRCSHGSSLSTAMHGLVAARLGRTEDALDYFRRTAAIDLGDATVAIAGGIHMAALGGLWQIAVLGFVGVTFHEDGIGLKPHLPVEWTALRVPLQWRGRSLAIAIDNVGRTLSISMDAGEAMAIHAFGALHRLEPDKPLALSIPVAWPAAGRSGHAAL